MSTLDYLLLLVGMMIVTFGVRYPVLALVGKLDLPESVLRALHYVPPAVLTAIVVPAVLMPDGKAIDFSANAAYLAGALVAVLVAWRTRSLALTILIGMAVFLGWRLLVG